jgi:hypothetical protein
MNKCETGKVNPRAVGKRIYGMGKAGL